MDEKSIVPQLRKLTKTEIELAASNIVAEVTELGNFTPLQAYVQLKALAQAIDQAINLIETEAMDEAKANRGESYRGAIWQTRKGSPQYSYAHDTKWAELKEQEKELANIRKKREVFLRSLEEAMVDPATGEYIEPAQVIGHSKPALAIKFEAS